MLRLRLLLRQWLVGQRGNGTGHELSEIEDVRGTEPVRRTVIIPRARSVRPKDLEKYSSRARWCQRDGMDIVVRSYG